MNTQSPLTPLINTLSPGLNRAEGPEYLSEGYEPVVSAVRESFGSIVSPARGNVRTERLKRAEKLRGERSREMSPQYGHVT